MTHEPRPTDPGDYPANPDDLKALFDSSTSWLRANRPIFDFTAAGILDGVPVVVKGAPGYGVSVAGYSVEAMLPEEARRLNIGPKIAIEFTPPYIEAVDLIHTHSIVPEPAGCMFIIETGDGSGATNSLLLAEETDPITGESSIVSKRLVEWSRESPQGQLQSGLSYEQHVYASIESEELARELGTDGLTGTECADLQTIVDNLGALTNAIE